MSDQDSFTNTASSFSLERSEIFTSTEHCSEICHKLQHFYEKQQICDIVVIAGIDNSKIHAHRLVLSAASDYFLAMFNSTLKEANANEITIDNVDGKILKLIFDFLYSGSIQLHSSTVENILRAADYFQIGALVDDCCVFMGDELDTSNCLGIALFAEQHSYTMLYEESIALAYSCIAKISKEKEFLKISKEQLCRFIFSENLYGVSQEHVLHCILSWVEYDKSRQEFMYSLLSHVHFHLLESEFIAENSKAICKSIECYELIRKWLEWHLSPKSRTKSAVDPAEQCKAGKLVFVTCDRDFHLQTFNPELKEWKREECPLSLKSRSDYGIAAVNGKLIIAGGKICERVTKTVECLDFDKKEWSELPPMALARCRPGMVELNGHLYVVGGESSGIWLCSVEVYDFTLQSWTYSEPLSLSLSWIEVAVLNGVLYAVGKVNDSNQMECYDPDICKWSTTNFERQEGIPIAMTAVGRKLYTIGSEYGGELSETVEYEPLNNIWTSLRSINASYTSCAALKNRLISYVAYKDGDEWENNVEEYNPETVEWMKLAPLLPHDPSMSCRLLSI